MATQPPLFAQSDLEDRVSKLVVARILNDDDVGIASPNAIQRIIADASATVWAFLPADTPLWQTTTAVPDYIKKLALDLATGYLYQRFPEYVRGADSSVIIDRAMKDLELFRKQHTSVKEVPRDDTFAVVVASKGRDRSFNRTR